MGKLTLKLFVTGHTIRAESAIRQLRETLDPIIRDQYDLTVVDVLENPQAAEDHLILVTPTLLKLKPFPSKRIIGDLSDRKELLAGLDLASVNSSTNQKSTRTEKAK